MTAAFLLALGIGSSGCGGARLPIATRPAALSGTADVVYLIGDAGDVKAQTPILRQLRRDIETLSPSVSATVVFLGDNVYDDGVRDADHPGFPDDSLRLESQVDMIRGTRAHGIFVPGNHDWADGSAEGLQNMMNQTGFIRRQSARGVSVEVLPPDGCPGPFVRDVGAAARLIAIDTHWWLHDPDRRVNVDCARQSEAAVLDALAGTLDSLDRGRRAIVVAHHPLETFGKHGGYFMARYWFFPLTELVSWAYLPIPFLYPAARNSGITNQDLSGPRNRAMRKRLVDLFRRYGNEPMVYAAGHEHTLQVFDGSRFGVGTHVVSGAGSKLDEVIDVGRSDFLAGRQHGEYGYMKLEFLDDGSVVLSVFTDGSRDCEGDNCPVEPALRYIQTIR
jgi:hypothetical protein